MWALGYKAGIRIRWYTPLLCRLFGKRYVDPSNGVRTYTFRGVTLLDCRAAANGSKEE